MLGKWTGEMRKMSEEFTRELTREAELSELRDLGREMGRDIKARIDKVLNDDTEEPKEIAQNPFTDEKPLEIAAGAEREQIEDVPYEPVEAAESQTVSAHAEENHTADAVAAVATDGSNESNESNGSHESHKTHLAKPDAA